MAEQSEYCLLLLSSGWKTDFPLNPSETTSAGKCEHHLLLPERRQKLSSLFGQGDGPAFMNLGYRVEEKFPTWRTEPTRGKGEEEVLLVFGWNKADIAKIVRLFFSQSLDQGKQAFLEAYFVYAILFWVGGFFSSSFRRQQENPEALCQLCMPFFLN